MQDCLACRDLIKHPTSTKACNLVCSQTIMRYPKPTRECYIIDRFVRTDRAFVLINQDQRRSFNFGFRMLHAEQQRNTFMSKFADKYRRNFADTIHRQHCYIGRYILVCRYIGRALLRFILLLSQIYFTFPIVLMKEPCVNLMLNFFLEVFFHLEGCCFCF